MSSAPPAPPASGRAAGQDAPLARTVGRKVLLLFVVGDILGAGIYSLTGKVARITVRLDADIAAVTRDAEGNVIAGSLTDAVDTHDVWTFSRTLKSDDPNWKLSETDEA